MGATKVYSVLLYDFLKIEATHKVHCLFDEIRISDKRIQMGASTIEEERTRLVLLLQESKESIYLRPEL